MKAPFPRPRRRNGALSRPRRAAGQAPRRAIWLDRVEQRLPLATRWRRPRALWVPSLGTACGVAEYSAHLAALLPATRVHASALPIGDARLVHVQHEDSLFDPARLARHLEETRRAGGRVVITEHSVRD